MAQHHSILEELERGVAKSQMGLWNEGVLSGLKMIEQEIMRQHDMNPLIQQRLMGIIKVHQKHIKNQQHEDRKTSNGIPSKVWTSGRG